MIPPDQHQLAADEVWKAIRPDLASTMNYNDFVLGFKLGRVSMRATMDTEPTKQHEARKEAL